VLVYLFYRGRFVTILCIYLCAGEAQSGETNTNKDERVQEKAGKVDGEKAVKEENESEKVHLT